MIAMSKCVWARWLALLGARLYGPVTHDEPNAAPDHPIATHWRSVDSTRLMEWHTNQRSTAGEGDDPDHPSRGVDHGPPAVAFVDTRPLEVEHIVVFLGSAGRLRCRCPWSGTFVVEADEHLRGHVRVPGGAARGRVMTGLGPR